MREANLRDQRQYPRMPVERQLMVLFDFAGRGAAREASTVDLSRKGARIRTDIELTLGQSVDLLAKNSVNTVAEPGGLGRQHTARSSSRNRPAISTRSPACIGLDIESVREGIDPPHLCRSQNRLATNCDRARNALALRGKYSELSCTLTGQRLMITCLLSLGFLTRGC